MNGIEKTPALLTLDKLSVEYRVREGWLSAVKDVDLTVKHGEVFAIVGESGCGKSTLAYSIMRLSADGNERVSGSIKLEGQELTTLSRSGMESVRGKSIGMIFQNPLDSLNPVYTTGCQVEEALFLDGASKKEAWEKTLELYRKVRMSDPEKNMRSYPYELSGGMRQRVMIAMMLARSPKLLIADEPTTALDVTIEAQILYIMRTLKNEFGTSILMITHNFGIVASIADRIGVMYAGELVEVASVYDIFEHPTHPYTRLLMRALPRKSKKEGRLVSITGSVPRLTENIPGCRFANRCDMARDVCFEQLPKTAEVGEGHICRCHRAGEAGI